MGDEADYQGMIKVLQDYVTIKAVFKAKTTQKSENDKTIFLINVS